MMDKDKSFIIRDLPYCICHQNPSDSTTNTLAQNNFMEGVIWWNDPGHCDVLGEWLMDTDAMMSVFGINESVKGRAIANG